MEGITLASSRIGWRTARRPSTVAFTADAASASSASPPRRQAVTNPTNTIFAVQTPDDRPGVTTIQPSKKTRRWCYKIVRAGNGDAWVEAGNTYSPSQISAFILQKMKETVEPISARP
jgi:molecular chaperone DnaK